MLRPALTVCLALFAIQAYATFELSDPANQMMEELEEDAWINQGESACKNYVKNRRKNNEAYFASLKWLIEYGETAPPELAASLDPDGMARWIDGYCLANPERRLAEAADEYLRAAAGND